MDAEDLKGLIPQGNRLVSERVEIGPPSGIFFHGTANENPF